MGCKELSLDCRLLCCCVVSIVLSCLARYPHPSMPSTLTSPGPGLTSHTSGAALLAPTVCPRLGLLGDYLPSHSLDAGSSLARSRAHLVGVGRHPRVISHQISVINPHRGTISQSLTCQELLSGLQRTALDGQSPLSPAVIAISGISCPGRLATLHAAIRAGNYPADDSQTTVRSTEEATGRHLDTTRGWSSRRPQPSACVFLGPG